MSELKIAYKKFKNREIAAMKVLSIAAIPHESLLKNDNETFQDIIIKCRENIKKLTTEIYNVYKIALQKSLACDIAFELLWKTEKVENQTYNARVKLYFIIRSISKSEDEASVLVSDICNLCASTLDFLKFDYAEMDVDDFSKEALSLNDAFSSSVIKDDKITSLQNQYIPYIYSFGKYKDCKLNLENLTNILLGYPDVAVSMQLIPASYSNAEYLTVDTNMQNLDTLSNGLFEQGVGNVRFSLAEKDLTTYKYYSENKGGPLFLYNILVYGSEAISSAIANNIAGQLSLNGSISLKNIKLRNELNYPKNLFTLPWIANEKLISHSNCYNQFLGNASLKNHLRLAHLITNEEAISFFNLPVGSDDLAAGIDVRKTQKGNKHFADNIINSDGVVIGTLRSSNSKSTISLSPNDFTKHMLITGTPGSGKTTFSVGLLHKLWKDYKIPFLVIEPAKNEYRALIGKIPDLQVFTPGKTTVSPLLLNPFVPPKNVKLETYKSSLKTAFSAAVSMSSPLDKIFEDALNNCYSDFDWLDTYTSNDKGKIFNISDFIKCFKYTFDEIGYKGDASNIGRAGTVRLKSLVNLFDNYFSVPIEDLISKPTVIELAAIENSDQKALIIALILVSILSYANANYEGKENIKNLILLEEAHVLLDSQSNLGQGEADPSGIAISLLKRMLAEMRSYGIGIIVADQSPRKVTQDIVGLTDIKLTFRLVEATDKKIICDSTNMSENQMLQLGRLRPGEAMLFFGKLDAPEEIITPNYRVENGIDITISDRELADSVTYWSDKQDKMRPYPECDYNKNCKTQCTYSRRLLAKETARKIFRKEILARLNEKNIKEMDLIRQLFGHITFVVKRELNDDFSLELFSCVKTFLWRMIRYNMNVAISDDQIKNSLNK